jgi:hypothetical protein
VTPKELAVLRLLRITIGATLLLVAFPEVGDEDGKVMPVADQFL